MLFPLSVTYDTENESFVTPQNLPEQDGMRTPYRNKQNGFNFGVNL